MDREETDWNREFIFTDTDFNFLRNLIMENTGITLSESKRELVYSRLTKRLRQLNFRSFRKYCELLKNDAEGEELVHFTNAITTNLTAFYREPHHFSYLEKNIFPDYMKQRKNKIRIWSAGCSSGEEPYSLAAVAVNVFGGTLSGVDLKILATDLDSCVLEKARTGMYDTEKLRSIDAKIKNRWFLKTRGNQDGKLRIRGELQDLITFKKLNLMHAWPMKGPFDIIFCRNVVIYFNKATQKKLVERFADILSDSGYLFMGHSESLFKVSDRFRLVGQTIYQKIK